MNKFTTSLAASAFGLLGCNHRPPDIKVFINTNPVPVTCSNSAGLCVARSDKAVTNVSGGSSGNCTANGYIVTCHVPIASSGGVGVPSSPCAPTTELNGRPIPLYDDPARPDKCIYFDGAQDAYASFSTPAPSLIR